MLQIVGVGSFYGHTEGSAPDLSRTDSKSTGHAEHDGVVLVLGEAKVHEKGTRATVYVGPGVLDLTSSG
jgi:hypothetical protein